MMSVSLGLILLLAFIKSTMYFPPPNIVHLSIFFILQAIIWVRFFLRLAKYKYIKSVVDRDALRKRPFRDRDIRHEAEAAMFSIYGHWVNRWERLKYYEGKKTFFPEATTIPVTCCSRTSPGRSTTNETPTLLSLLWPLSLQTLPLFPILPARH